MNATLSRDGKYAAWAQFPQEGDGELIVRELASGKELRESVGELPPPPLPSPDELEPPPPRGVKITFTYDGRFVLSSSFASKADKDKARKEKKKPEEMPKGGLVIVDIKERAAARVSSVKSYAVPEKGESWLAWSLEPKTPEKPEPGRKKPEFGTDLVVRDLRQPEATARTIADVLEYSFARDGKTLVYAVASRKEETNGVFALAPGGQPAALLAGKGKYSKLTWDRPAAQLAFLSDHDAPGARPPKLKAYLWDRKAAAALEAVSATTPGFHGGWVIGSEGPVSFARNGSKLFIGCAPPAPPEPEKDADTGEEKVLADLWSWKDDFVQPMQKVRANRERSRAYTGVLDIASKRFLQVGGPELASLAPSDDGRYGLGGDDRAYRRMVDFDGNYSDYYVVDHATGAREKVLEKQRSGMGASLAWSPDGRYAVFFRDRHWHSLGIPDGTLTNLTAKLPAAFYNEEEDVPAEPESYGSAGWTKDGRWVLLYDRFDVWQVSPDGATARNLTSRYGRDHKTEFRVIRFPEDDDAETPRGIDPARPLLLRAENIETRESGFFRAGIDASAAPVKLAMAAANLRTVAKAKEANIVLFTASTFHDFPDLQVTSSDFRESRRISDANPQKAQLLWGTGELIRFRNADGVPLQAALYKPENFDPHKKYPLIVYIYEKLSQGVNTFVEPRPGHSINFAYYVSNGYLVLTPDIVYTEGFPGQSAVKCVLPALDTVVNLGFVDEKAIGIQGHSWGGYQTAYLVSHSDRFRAAEAGAPVGNMTSAYNGIRWGTGLPRQFQYEKTQSRIGGTLWQYPLRFIENSPIFSADRIRTPLLILHDDNDDAVPWYQGIEFFLSLRRLGKEAYLFNYNGEYHGLRKRVNQKDYTVRMQQYFDHFLKGAPAPEWMEHGIPFVEREREKEKFQHALTGGR